MAVTRQRNTALGKIRQLVPSCDADLSLREAIAAQRPCSLLRVALRFLNARTRAVLSSYFSVVALDHDATTQQPFSRSDDIRQSSVCLFVRSEGT